MKKYYFTFSCGVSDPYRNCYTVIEAKSYETARELMFKKYGNQWAFQYTEDEWIIDPAKDPYFKKKAIVFGWNTDGTKPVTQAELYNLTEIK